MKQCLIVQEEERIPSLLTVQNLNTSMADVALELATRKCCSSLGKSVSFINMLVCNFDCVILTLSSVISV